MEVADDDAEHARLWDEDEQAQDIAELAFESLLEHVDLDNPLWKQRRVLDVGCGTGLLTAELAPLVGQVVAVDVDRAMLGVLREKGIANVEIRHADIERDLPLLGGVDLIVASCVCGALSSYPKALERLVAVLRHGGIFAQWDWLRAADDPEGDGLTLDDVTAAFQCAGLSRVHVDREFEALLDEDSILMGVGLKMVIVGGPTSEHA